MRLDIAMFINRHAYLTLICIVMQQSLVASATYFLTRLMERFQSGLALAPWLYLYCGAMLLPYIPGCLGHIALVRWINGAHAAYVKSALSVMVGWRGKEVTQAQRSFVQTLIGKQSLVLIDDLLRFVQTFTDFFASSLLNVIVLASLLPGDLAIGYAISAAACTAALFFLRKPIDRLAGMQEAAHIRFSSHLTHAWDNITIGNLHNHAQWQARNREFAKTFYGTCIRLTTVTAAGDILLALLTLSPSIYLLLATLNDATLQPVVAAALIANLTRIFHVLSGVTALVSQALGLRAVLARTRMLFGGWPAPDSLREVGAKRMALAMPISINDEIQHARDEALTFLASRAQGRFTIRGPNGAGKSTFLRSLKFRVGDSAFYLPAHTEGLVWQSDLEGMSTGQRMISHLKEIEALSGVTHILLDEWDANLDQRNCQMFNHLLDVAAETRVVIEVRH